MIFLTPNWPLLTPFWGSKIQKKSLFFTFRLRFFSKFFFGCKMIFRVTIWYFRRNWPFYDVIGVKRSPPARRVKITLILRVPEFVLKSKEKMSTFQKKSFWGHSGSLMTSRPPFVTLRFATFCSISRIFELRKNGSNDFF